MANPNPIVNRPQAASMLAAQITGVAATLRAAAAELDDLATEARMLPVSSDDLREGARLAARVVRASRREAEVDSVILAAALVDQLGGGHA